MLEARNEPRPHGTKVRVKAGEAFRGTPTQRNAEAQRQKKRRPTTQKEGGALAWILLRRKLLLYTNCASGAVVSLELQGVVSDAEHYGALAVSRERSI